MALRPQLCFRSVLIVDLETVVATMLSLKLFSLSMNDDQYVNMVVVFVFYVDMGSLMFQIGLGHMTDDSMVIGQAVITNLSGLSVTNPLKGYEDISVLYSYCHSCNICQHFTFQY